MWLNHLYYYLIIPTTLEMIISVILLIQSNAKISMFNLIVFLSLLRTLTTTSLHSHIFGYCYNLHIKRTFTNKLRIYSSGWDFYSCIGLISISLFFYERKSSEKLINHEHHPTLSWHQVSSHPSSLWL